LPKPDRFVKSRACSHIRRPLWRAIIHDDPVIPLLLSLIGGPRLLPSCSDIAVEVLALRQQVAVLKRRRPRPPLRPLDRLFWTSLRATWSRWRDAVVIVKPETVVGWHRAGFRLCWRWKSRPRWLPGVPRAARGSAIWSKGAVATPHSEIVIYCIFSATPFHVVEHLAVCLLRLNGR
jgi:hypothetical protein